MEGILEKICRFADQAHGEQLRKYASDRYIVHPVRVMEICQKYTQNMPMLAAALLHDVLEDTPVNKDQILEFMNGLMDNKQATLTVNLVEELSDVYVKSSYPHLNRKQRKAKEADRIQKTSAGAQTIKYADILDNCREIVEHDRQFAPVFLKECRNLLKIMDKGNKNLQMEAFKAVNEGLKKLKKH